MPVARHSFAKLDTDSDASIKPSSAFDAAQSISLEPGYITAVAGNVAVPYALPATGRNVRLGGFTDGATGTAVSLLYNSLGSHRLIRYDPAGNGGVGEETTLLEWSGLHLSADLVLHGGITDHSLLFIDATGTWRNVNLARAIAGEYTPAVLAADPYALHLVKLGPQYAPLVTRRVSTAVERSGTALRGHDLQIALRYRYQDGETTVLSPFSAVLVVRPEDSTDYASVRFDAREAISPLVQEVEVVQRLDTDDAWVVAKTLRRDATGTFPSVTLDGTHTGLTLTVGEATKQSEALPTVSRAGTVAHSRLMATNFREGLPAPATRPALTAAAINYATLPPITGTITLVRHVGVYTFDDGQGGIGQQPYDTTVAYYQVTTDPQTGAPLYCLAELNAATGLYELSTALFSFRQITAPYTAATLSPDNVTTTTITANIAPGGGTTDVTLKTGAAYRLGIVYRDEFGRSGGIESSVDVSIPGGQGLSQAVQNAWFLRFALPDGDASDQIPAWAKTWQLALTPPLGISYFVQAFLVGRRYFGDNANGSPNFTPGPNGTGATDLAYTDLTTLTNQGIGYTYSAGDRLRIGNSDVEAIGQRGQYLITRVRGQYASNIGTYPTELYSPSLATEQANYYAIGPVNDVQRRQVSGIEQRSYGTITGDLPGDVYLVARDSLQAQAKVLLEGTHPRLEGREKWPIRRTRPSVAVPGVLRVVERHALIRFSGVKVAGTQVNGLGQWEALNQFDELPQEQGAVMRLTVADQTQTDGSILLVNQERGDVSLQLGQGRIQTADGEALLTVTKSVIGGANALRGGYGCTDPATVTPYAGKVFYYCAHRTELLRYDRNGLTPLGLTYKARTLLAAVARQYAGATVRACFNPAPGRKELWLTFGPVGLLPGVTLVYSDLHEAWAGTLPYAPEAGLAVDNELVTWSTAALHRHTPDAPAATFAGVYTAPSLTFTVAAPGGVAKHFHDVAIESGSLWLPSALSTDTGLTSRTLGAWFTHREGIWRTGLRRAENTPGFPTIYHALNNGVPLVGSRLSVTVVAPVGAAPLTAVSISFTPRSGQGMSA